MLEMKPPDRREGRSKRRFMDATTEDMKVMAVMEVDGKMVWPY